MSGSQVIAMYVQLFGQGCGAHEHGGGAGGGGGNGTDGVTAFDEADDSDETP